MKRKLLVVDDSKFMRMVIKKILVTENVDIIEGGDGQEAIDLYKAESPDLVLLDVTMPLKDGFEALVEILNHDKQAKVVMCSSMVYEKNMKTAIREGALDFIRKPFEDDQLLTMTRRFLQ
jgi:two-component system, chemotaxis family, chemotaxis protein CheY